VRKFSALRRSDSSPSLPLSLSLRETTAVAAVADGMKAWEVMRARAYAFDLVLTEVAMPSLSGIQLLSRIVAADECKNIPVISKPFSPFPSSLDARSNPDSYFLSPAMLRVSSRRASISSLLDQIDPGNGLGSTSSQAVTSSKGLVTPAIYTV
jgi:DNA-binding NarL/FixJ family response regulator